MRIQTVSILALCLGLTACANPQVPDFMVKGELPFGHDDQAPTVAQPDTQAQPKAKKDKKPEKPATAVAAAPAAPAARPAPPPQAASAPPAAKPAPAPVAAPPAAISPRPQAAPKREPAPEPRIVGGFQPMRDKNKAKAVAAFAADAAPIGYLLKDIEYVNYQVVAGMNYDLCLEVRRAFRETSGWRTRKAKAEVFEDLNGNLTLMTWEEVKTCP